VQIYQKGVSLQPEMDAQKTLLSDSYLSIASLSEGAYKDNGSRFISFLYPCTSAEQADLFLSSVRKNIMMQLITAMRIGLAEWVIHSA